MPIRSLALVLLFASAARAQTEMPAFEGAFAVQYLTFESDSPYQVFRALRPLPGRAEPSASSPEVRTVAAGQSVGRDDWDRLLTVTVRPGQHVALRDVALYDLADFGQARSLDTSDLGRTVASLVVRQGETVEVLHRDGDNVVARIRGSVYLFDGFSAGLPGDPGVFREEQAPAEQIWIRLVPTPGQPAAWVHLVTQTDGPDARNIEFGDRPDD